ncbi:MULTISPECIES: YciE/YciF family protein [Xanthomonas]|uniref:YciE/YciF family protein n=1 Tax=Xanthomonas TaxID=338 RepID=UPI00235336F2|nr:MULTISPECIES: YciE/YciF family protein [Xanthomonas]
MRDVQAQSVCWQTLPQDEEQDQAMADWLLALLPALIEEFLVRDAIPYVTATLSPPALML